MNLFSLIETIPHLLILSFFAVAILLFSPSYKSYSSDSGGWMTELLKFFALIGLLFSTAVFVQKINTSPFRPGTATPDSMIFTDLFSYFVTVMILLCSILNLPLITNFIEKSRKSMQADILALYLFSIVGAIIFATSANLMLIFLGLEIMSLAVYCLCGAAIDKRESAESGIKYFVLGSVASAFFLYGVAMMYGATGSLSLIEITKINQTANASNVVSNHVLLTTSLFLMSIGLIFKIGAAPLHFWLPDVYKGAPVSIVSYMSSVVKIASMSVTFRILTEIFSFNSEIWHQLFGVTAALSLIIGSLLAVTQTNVKKMLAFSSIVQVGYMLIACVSASDIYGGGTAFFYYLIIYSFVSIGLFSVLTLFASESEQGSNAFDLARFRGLNSRRPVLAAVISLLLLTLAGLPPGIAGLTGKLFIFSAGIKAGMQPLVIIACVSIIISAYYYLRVIGEMYFKADECEMPENSSALTASPGGEFTLKGVAAICSFAVIYLGIKPDLIYEILGMVMFGFGR